MKFGWLRGALIVVAAAMALGAPAPKAGKNDGSPPVMMSRSDRVPWSNLAELEKFAAAGNPRACSQLGEMCLAGNGVSKDIPRALALLEKAARAGESSAAFRLGMLYDDGNGVPQDRLRAQAYFKAAAAGGANEAFYNIGSAYVSARGVKRDYVEGLAWLILAQKHGAPAEGVTTVRDRITKLGHPEWIAAAEKRAPELEKELAAKKPQEFLPAPQPAK